MNKNTCTGSERVEQERELLKFQNKYPPYANVPENCPKLELKLEELIVKVGLMQPKLMFFSECVGGFEL